MLQFHFWIIGRKERDGHSLQVTGPFSSVACHKTFPITFVTRWGCTFSGTIASIWLSLAGKLETSPNIISFYYPEFLEIIVNLLHRDICMYMIIANSIIEVKSVSNVMSIHRVQQILEILSWCIEKIEIICD